MWHTETTQISMGFTILAPIVEKQGVIISPYIKQIKAIPGQDQALLK